MFRTRLSCLQQRFVLTILRIPPVSPMGVRSRCTLALVNDSVNWSGMATRILEECRLMMNAQSFVAQLATLSGRKKLTSSRTAFLQS